MNIQDNMETFEPNVDVKIPQNKDVFYECTSLTRISQVPDDNFSSLSKDNSRTSKFSGVGNEIMIKVGSNQ